MIESRDHFRMRSYQRKPLEAKRAGCKRFVEKLHRRAGKDRNWLAITLISMLERVGNYFHIFPALNMGRRDIWDNVIQEKVNGVERSLKMTDMFPPELIAPNGVNQTEMQITLVNGSVWQIMGADDQKAIDRLRGPNPIGVVLSEYAFMNPNVWKVLQPVLAENGGWAAFVSTPNTEDDEFDKLSISAQNDPTWFYQCLTVDDTRRDAAGEDGSPVITIETIEDMRRHGAREEEIRREYYCDTKGYRHGTIYGDLITETIAKQRVGRFSYISTLPVGTCWDLGYSSGDRMAVWFYQRPNPTAVYFIDYVEKAQTNLQQMTRVLREDKGYIYGRMCLPHDGKQAEEFFHTVGFKNIQVAERPVTIQSGIDQVRIAFPQFFFDEINCVRGLECLKKYKYEYDLERRAFTGKPIHDEYSHGADGLRSGVACGFDPLEFIEGSGKPIKVEMDFDPRMLNSILEDRR